MTDKRKIFFLSIATIFLISELHLAQDKDSNSAFSKLMIGGTYVWNNSTGDLDEYWNVQNGIEAFIKTPFYAGDISLGVMYSPFAGSSRHYPDFNSYYINLGWTVSIELFKNTSFFAGARIGSFMMTFQDDTLSAFREIESEIGVGAQSGLTVGITEKIDLYFGANLLSVFTNRKMKLLNLQTGISYSFTTPRWIKELVK